MSFNNFDKESLARIASEAIEGFEKEVLILGSALKVTNHYTCNCIGWASTELGNSVQYTCHVEVEYSIHANTSRVSSWATGFQDILQKGKPGHLQETNPELLRDIRLERMYLFNREHFCMDGVP